MENQLKKDLKDCVVQLSANITLECLDVLSFRYDGVDDFFEMQFLENGDKNILKKLYELNRDEVEAIVESLITLLKYTKSNE